MGRQNVQKALLKGIAALIFLLFGLWNGPWGCMGLRLDHLPGDLGDTRLNIYLLEHGYKWMTGQESSFWDAPFFYPQSATITYSENFLGALPPYALLRFVGFGRDLAFQWWVLLMFAFTYLASLVVFKKLTTNFWVALAGAYFFAFGLSMVTNYSHAQTFARFCIPVAFYGLLRYFETARTRHFALLVFAVVWQLYCGLYLGIFLVLGLAAAALGRMWALGWGTLTEVVWNRRLLLGQSAIFFGAILAVLPLLLPYHAQSTVLAGRSFAEVLPTVPTLASHFYTTWGPKLWGFLAKHDPPVQGPFWLHYLFLGAMPWTLLAVGAGLVVRNWRSAVRFSMLQTVVAGLLILFLFATQFDGFTLYKLIWYLPGFNSIRDVHRVVCIQAAFFAFVLVLVGAAMVAKWPKLAQWAFLLPVLVLTDGLFDPTTLSRVEVKRCIEVESAMSNALFQTQHKADAIAFLPLHRDTYNAELTGGPLAYQITAMLVGQKADLPTVNGYSGYFPDGFTAFNFEPSVVRLAGWIHRQGRGKQVLPVLDTLVQPSKIQLVSFRTGQGDYLCSEASMNKQKVIANRNQLGDWELFGLLWYGDSMLIQTHDVQYLRLNEEGILIADHGISATSWLGLTRLNNGRLAFTSFKGSVVYLTDHGPEKFDTSLAHAGFEVMVQAELLAE